MNENQKKLKQRAVQAAEEVLHRQQYVSPIDFFIGMKLLQPVHVDDWRKGKIPYLEKMIQVNLSKITFCMNCLDAWAKEKALKPSLTSYLARTNGPKRELRFSASGSPKIEQFYRTHYISPILSEIKQKKLQEKLDKPPELVVFRIVQDSQCSQCKKVLLKGDFLFMEGGQPLCLCCAHLNELEYLPRGNAQLTCRVKKESSLSIVVVEFSRTRKRYERQGILVEKDALRKAQKELMIEDDDDYIPF